VTPCDAFDALYFVSDPATTAQTVAQTPLRIEYQITGSVVNAKEIFMVRNTKYVHATQVH
jgi:hypothetical protein